METTQPVRRLLYLIFGVCPLLFFTDLTRNPYYTQIALLNILIPACWLIILGDAWKTKEVVWVRAPLDPVLYGLIGYSLATWGASFYAHPAFHSPIYSEGSRAAIFLIVNTALVYALALRVQNKDLIRRLLWITYGVGFLASAYGLMQYFGVELIWPHSLNPYGSRPVSTFGNPNFMSSFLVVIMPVILADCLMGITQMPRALLLLIWLTCFSALLATLTRSSWMGGLVGTLIVVAALYRDPPQFKRSVNKLIGLSALCGALIVFWPQGEGWYSISVLGRLMEVTKATQVSYGAVHQRFIIWLSAWGMVLDHPFLGKGWGCFELFYPFYQGAQLLVPGFSTLRTHANNCHNEIMEYWSQLGTLGLGGMILLWISFFRIGLSVSRRLSGPTRLLAWGFVAGVAGMLVDNLLNVSVHFAVPAFIFWWWVGSLFTLDPEAVRLARVDLKPLWRQGVVALGMLGLVGLMARSFCMWRGEVNFFSGFKLSKAGVDLISSSRDLQRAYQWHHLEVNNNYELGNVHARLGEKDKAFWMYQRALDANAGYDEIYFNRATLLMQMGKNDEAIANFRICLGINPTSHDAYNALAGLYFKDLNRYRDQVEPLYLKGLYMFPKDKDLWNNLGYFYTQESNWDKAAMAYQKSLEIDPQFELARQNLARVLPKASAALKR